MEVVKSLIASFPYSLCHSHNPVPCHWLSVPVPLRNSAWSPTWNFSHLQTSPPHPAAFFKLKPFPEIWWIKWSTLLYIPSLLQFFTRGTQHLFGPSRDIQKPSPVFILYSFSLSSVARIPGNAIQPGLTVSIKRLPSRPESSMSILDFILPHANSLIFFLGPPRTYQNWRVHWVNFFCGYSRH